jgi:CheY-like chemotaxis protein
MGQDRPYPPGLDGQERVIPPRVFAVNSDPDMLNLLAILFRSEGYHVTTTFFGPDTFDRVAAAAPDLLLVDLAWGQRAGWDLLERLNREARTRAIPVVVTSTTPSYLDRVRADPDRYGDNRHALLSKPFDIDDALSAVHGLIGGA